MTIREMVARRSNPKVVGDDIPTPPYATRALYEYVIPEMKAHGAKFHSVWDPAAGQGHMLRVFREMGHAIVMGTDVTPSIEHGVNKQDFLDPFYVKMDLIVTNPPYKHLNDFIQLSLHRARKGVAVLVRVQALEGQRRFNEIYKYNPPTIIAFFSDRIPFKTGEVVRKAPKMFFHVWLWWDLSVDQPIGATKVTWIPPDAQERLERDEDYE